MYFNNIILDDMKTIYHDLMDKLDKIEGTKWLISGGGGFIGAYFLDFIDYCNQNVFKTPATVICIENYKTGTLDRIKHLQSNENFRFINIDISKTFDIDTDIDYIVHAASIASPTFYRKYPIETIETNVWGLKNLLELAKNKNIKSMLFFSTSEIYGNPTNEYIPTPETYNGNVSCTGPRACYDESKRLGETLCVNYCNQHKLPVKIVRPFNVYGPGLRIDDKRVIPDFFHDAFQANNINILSDGAPTRSFCYISDAVSGFLRALLSDCDGEAFNIGNDEIEISMIDLAEMVADIVGNTTVEYNRSSESEYLIDNPQRRCPDLSKAKRLIGYKPHISLDEGLKKLKDWYRHTYNI
ncbi:MAG TPA: NAD-dependent epimerase/dehydratase family protein [Clostridia bacterium]|nr:NAD-dependent epimerase/dehydratase family protein [Clostridia bacterium]